MAEAEKASTKKKRNYGTIRVMEELIATSDDDDIESVIGLVAVDDQPEFEDMSHAKRWIREHVEEVSMPASVSRDTEEHTFTIIRMVSKITFTSKRVVTYGVEEEEL